jgi:hypothetical protein
MTQKETEVRKKLDAIETVVKALSSFDEEEATDIIGFARKHLGFSGVAAAPAGQLHVGMGTGGAGDASIITDDIARFVDEKAPQNEYQRMAVLAYFLFKVRKLPNFTLKDLVAANREARMPNLSNPSYTLNKALTRYKFLSQAATQRGIYSISIQGEKLVEALPSLEGVPQKTRSTNGRKKAKKVAKKKA